ncbi:MULTISPECIES: metallophosphoesterase [unclassified Paenibacillus]|uniref:metallophosphoesterase family protein n=1 Tax=unclassified Paenibacillus TaxID=185978 RepID=UPI0009566D51|nr:MULTISPECIES: metallophosphoesterase [unclassified Paenibacillus]ASS66090.1 hypothetical protein CIC07_08015 [Paenibacillus sp. RUD330]SIQ12850.1 Calcineurin-like phosphoesterase [Paenibacillus sp. RU4X]SIQ34634.1 Calcineurin-like phosphoesterase [Paenibacillus sp. RU4T]
MDKPMIPIWTDESHDGPAQAGALKKPWFGQLDAQLHASRELSFAVLGDRCGMMTPGVFEDALETVRTLNPDFVLAVGDLIEGYWREEDNAHAEWDELDSLLEGLQRPVFPVVGNHDCGSELMRRVWEERKGSSYYAFRIGGLLFLMLNTEDPPMEMPDVIIDVIKEATDKFHRDPEHADEHMQAFFQGIMETMDPSDLVKLSQVELAIGERQLRFAERVLADNADAEWTFVTMHKPGWKAESPAFDRLMELLKERRFTVFAGHLHTMEYTSSGEQEWIQLGRTGGHGHGSGPQSEHLVLWATVKDGRPSYRVLELSGMNRIEGYDPKPHVHEEKEAQPK